MKTFEIDVRGTGNYCKVTWNIFRSWGGPRKVNGKHFYGNVFLYLSNDVAIRRVRQPLSEM